jgi:hypothetical protein
MKWRGVNSGQLMSAINLNNNGSYLSIGNVNGSVKCWLENTACRRQWLWLSKWRRGGGMFNIMAENQ